MLPELTIERVFRRELDALPLPNEQLWVPARRTGPSAIVAASVVGAALVLVLAAGGLIREASGAATQPRGAVGTLPSLPARSTCEPAFGGNGRCVTLVPNSVRNPAFGYNLTVPGGWHEVQMPPGADPFVHDQPAAEPSLTAPFLLDRQIFTGRPPREWVLVTDNAVPAWDLDVQVWDRQGRTALEWSRTFPCNAPEATFGATNCVQTTEVIRGMTAVVTTVYSFRWHITSYYLERGDQMVILRYMSSETVAPPTGVTEETLQGIVRSIGLV